MHFVMTINKKWLSSYPVYWRNANSQNYFRPNGLWQIGNIWSTTERNKNTTIGCVVPAWSMRGNPKLCRGKPKLCRGKSKLCRGPTNPKISQNHVRSENVVLNLWKNIQKHDVWVCHHLLNHFWGDLVMSIVDGLITYSCAGRTHIALHVSWG